jgi:hypothetical protein
MSELANQWIIIEKEEEPLPVDTTSAPSEALPEETPANPASETAPNLELAPEPQG